MFKILIVLTGLICYVESYLPKDLGTLNIKLPAFATFVPNNDNSNHHLIITSFSGFPYSTDNVYYAANISTLNFDNVKVLKNTNLKWPNEATFYSSSLYGKDVDPYGGVMVPFGFLVPTKTKGGLHYYPFAKQDRSEVIDQEPINVISDPIDTTDWFYHRTLFVDLTGDGKVDILTCRTNKPMFGQTRTQLVGLVLNELNNYEENVINEMACDVFFDWTDLDKDGRYEIIAAGFFFSKLNVIYSEDKNNNFLNGNTKVRTIDDAAGQLFDVKVDDLDNDGNLEILATNHQGNGQNPLGALFYYTLTGDVRTGNFEKFIISEDFHVLKGGFNQAAPGAAKLFHPNLNDKSRKHILLAGDGSEYGYYYEPTQAPAPLNYTLKWSKLFGNTVGQIAVADIDNDGYTEAVIPVYENNICFFYTFKP